MTSLIYLLIWLRQRNKIFLFWFLAVILWQTIPSILNDLYTEYDDAIGFNWVEKLQVQFIELLSALAWSVPFLLFPKVNNFKNRSFRSRKVFWFLLNMYFFLGIILLFNNLTGIGFELPLSFLYLKLATKILPIYCVYVLFNSKNHVFRIFCFLLLLISVVGGGSHGPLIFISIYAIYLSYSKGVHRRYTLLFVTLGVMFLSLFGDLMHDVRSLDVGKVKKLTMGEKIVLISGLRSELNGYEISTNSNADTDILKDVIWRFGENRRVSSGYIRWVDRYGFVGVIPIINSLKSIVPRQFWQEKPEAGSYNGQVYGKGMHIVHKMTYGNEKNMSGYYTGLHEYWLMGLFGTLLLSLLSGVFQYVILIKLTSFGEAGVLVIIAVYSIWWQMPKLWFSEIILHLFTIYLPLVIFFISMIFVYNTFKIKSIT